MNGPPDDAVAPINFDDWRDGLPCVFVETDAMRNALYEKEIPAISLEEVNGYDNPVDSFYHWNGVSRHDGNLRWFVWEDREERGWDGILLSEKAPDHPSLGKWIARMGRVFQAVRYLQVKWPVFITQDRHEIRSRLSAGGVVVAVGPHAELTAAELLDAKLAPPQWIVDQVVPATGLTLFTGRPKVGKSWAMLQLALGVATGNRRALGRFSCKRSRVTYAALEDSANQTASRIKTLWGKNPSSGDLDNLDLRWTLPSMDKAEDFADALEELIIGSGDGGNRTALVVIDPLLVVKGAVGNQDIVRREYQQMRLLRRFAERHQIAVLLTHHTSKPTSGGGRQNAIDAPNGTTGLSAAPDCLWLLARDTADTKHGRFSIRPRGSEDQDLIATLDVAHGFGWQITGTAEEVERRKRAERKALNSGLRGKILSALKGGQMLTAAGLADELEENYSSIRTTLSRLEEDGVILKDTSSKRYLLPPEKGEGGPRHDVNPSPSQD